MGYLITILCMVVLSAYFSATETAFLSLSRTRLTTMADKGNRRAALACQLYDASDKLISTILVGNNIVNIVAASVGTMYFVGLMGDPGAAVSTAVITILLLIFGEITPKSIAKDCPEAFACFSAPIIRVLIVVLTPLNAVFSGWKKLIARLLKVKENEGMSQEELIQLVEEVREEGVLDNEEGELVHRALTFSDLRADSILTPRVELSGVDETDDLEKVAAVFTETKFSRLLVYREDMDHIVGVLNQKDFYTGTGIAKEPLTAIMTPPVFAMPAEKIDDLLRRLQKEKSHIAVILDEYGGTLGIVTMEDILEELVGEIWDEHDEVEDPIEAIDEQTTRLSGTVSMEEFMNRFDIEIESESSTVAGWVTELFSRIPAVGEEVETETFRIRVTGADDHHITQLEVERLVVEPEEA